MKEILDLKDSLPKAVPWHETLAIFDATKVSCFSGCPRKFFIEFVMGWRKDEPNIHLVFGGAWHEAMEHLLNNGYSKESIKDAYRKFLKMYQDNYPDMLSNHGAKEPDNALNALLDYCSTFGRVDNFETLFTEVSGAVPISSDRIFHVKMDSVLRFPDGIWSMEHKTTGMLSRAQQEKWSDTIQIGGYTHALYSVFPADEVRGIKINLAVLRKPKKDGKSNNEFLRIPVRKSGDSMQVWLFEVNHWLDQIVWNFQKMCETSPDDPVMQAFPKNGESCGKFGCSHPGLCQRANPLKYGSEPPIGYKSNRWDPRRIETDHEITDGKIITKDKEE